MIFALLSSVIVGLHAADVATGTMISGVPETCSALQSTDPMTVQYEWGISNWSSSLITSRMTAEELEGIDGFIPTNGRHAGIRRED